MNQLKRTFSFQTCEQKLGMIFCISFRIIKIHILSCENDIYCLFIEDEFYWVVI